MPSLQEYLRTHSDGTEEQRRRALTGIEFGLSDLTTRKAIRSAYDGLHFAMALAGHVENYRRVIEGLTKILQSYCKTQADFLSWEFPELVLPFVKGARTLLVSELGMAHPEVKKLTEGLEVVFKNQPTGGRDKGGNTR